MQKEYFQNIGILKELSLKIWRKYCQLIFALYFLHSSLSAQSDSTFRPEWECKGYLSEIGSALIWNQNDQPVWDNLIHNRMNFSASVLPWMSATLHLRNRIMIGQSILKTPGYANHLEKDRGWFDLSFNAGSGENWLINSQIDRAYIHLNKNNWEVTLGRQRINWGQTFIWNPNDIFNAYSFLEFDYPEKPGSDGIRVQYFHGIAGSFEFAAKSDSSGKVTAAGLLKWNQWNYDFQMITGLLNESDYVAGFGWAGNILKAGFRGEFSYFHPKNNFSDTSGLFLFSVSTDYSFRNSWSLLTEVLVRWQDECIPEPNLWDYYSSPATVKNLALSDFSLLVQLSIPFTPLVNASIAGMGFPGKKGFYAGPSVGFSLSDNSELSLYSQFLRASFPILPGGQNVTQQISMHFLRFKWSF